MVSREPATCYCRCDAVWRAVADINYATGVIRTTPPCPRCGRDDNVRRVSHDPEVFTIEVPAPEARAGILKRFFQRLSASARGEDVEDSPPASVDPYLIAVKVRETLEAIGVTGICQGCIEEALGSAVPQHLYNHGRAEAPAPVEDDGLDEEIRWRSDARGCGPSSWGQMTDWLRELQARRRGER